MEITINTILKAEGFAESEPNHSSNIYVVIDVLRAGTTINTALINGTKEIIPCKTIDNAKEIYDKFPVGKALLCGERDGIKPIGFDLGNSPSEFINEIVLNKTLIMTTTNCTNAISKIKNNGEVLIGCFVNFSSVLNYIHSKVEENAIDITFVCAGDNGEQSFEDTICSGAYINSIVNRYENCYLSEVSKFALNCFLESGTDLRNMFYNSTHGKKLRSLGFEKDIEMAIEYDMFDVVPIFRDGRIISLVNSLNEREKKG
ncbi:MAG: 2-phosphosulfolactate phosphatase [Ignavibacteriae bacterium]|nr:2-phosphosulfolactate phosphatase [Ignavibacteriota bacterium]